MLPIRFTHVTLVVREYARARRFYAEQLGFDLVVDAPPHYARFRVPGNDATLR